MEPTTITDAARLKKAWRIKLALLATAILLAVASCIKAPYYAYEGGSILLQHLGTLVLLLPLAFELKRQRLSVPACICLFLFTCIHIVGARYLYSFVPYDEWAKKLLNIDLDIEGDWVIKAEGTGVMHGNKFDRLVHLSFGLLLFPFAYQLAKRFLKGITPFQALLFAWLYIQTASMIYELFEWIISVVLNPEEAEEYNGQQGDMWDAQKDMALALVGSTVSAFCIFLSERMRRRSRSGGPAGNENRGPTGDPAPASDGPEAAQRGRT